mmetsp:Transcript_12361/g.27737  ORF Transcript_12361/g.27737 Transcript_12361/m.27737 type:complete len:223 (+) Transcript_12361:162-830(+)
MYKQRYNSRQVKARAGQTTMSYRIERALATAKQDKDDYVLLRSGMTGIEFLSKMPACVAAFKKEEDCWRLIDPNTVPPYMGAGQQNLAVSLENEFAESAPLNTVLIVAERLTALRDATAVAFDALRAAVPIEAPAGPGGQQAFTAQQRANRLAQVDAERAGALLQAEMKTDEIRMAAEAREALRRRAHSKFEDRQTGALTVFHKIVAPELLGPINPLLEAGR